MAALTPIRSIMKHPKSSSTQWDLYFSFHQTAGKVRMHHYIFIISQLWLTSHPRRTVVLLDTGTPGTSREIYSEDADDCEFESHNQQNQNAWPKTLALSITVFLDYSTKSLSRITHFNCGQSLLYTMIGPSLLLVSLSELNTELNTNYRPDASLLLHQYLVNSDIA